MGSGDLPGIRVNSGETRAERTGHGPDRQTTQEGPAGPDQADDPWRGRRDAAAVLVDRASGGDRRRSGARHRHRLLRQPDPRHRCAARPARGRLGDAGRHRRRNLRLARPAARPDHRRAGLAAPGQRRHRHRGSPLLLALRRRPAGHAAGARGQPQGRPDRAGRVLDHPAGGQAGVVRQHPHARAQDQGNPGGAGAGVEVLQERDPVDLSQPGLPRQSAPLASRPPRSGTSASRRPR